jgi:hypothetical protein
MTFIGKRIHSAVRIKTLMTQLECFIISIPGKKFKDKKDIGAFLKKTDGKRGLPSILDHPKMDLSKNIIFSTG